MMIKREATDKLFRNARETAHSLCSEEMINNVINPEEETLEDLQLGGLKLIQKKHGFRYGMDSVLLADFAQVHPGDTVADFGCGTGILPLLMLGRGKGKNYIGIEIQEQMVTMARRSVCLNGLEDRVQILQGDVAQATDMLPTGSLDAIVCNPPYGQPGRVLLNQDEKVAIARHQKENTLSLFFRAAFLLLKGRGRLFLVYPAPEMFSLMMELKSQHLEPKRFRLVYPDLKHPANLVLLEAVKDAHPRLHPMPPLIVNDENGHLTNELMSIYHM